MRRLALGLLLAVALTACTTASPEGPRNYLAGTSWVRVDDDQANPHGATLAFSEDRATGHTGCNRWFASFTHDGEALDFGDVGMTRMACTSEVQQGTEQRFLRALDATHYAHYDRDALVLLDAQQNVIARFDRAD